MRHVRLPSAGTVYVVVLAVLLFVPADADWHAQRENRWMPVRLGMSPAAVMRDFVANVGIFVPVGFVFRRRWQRGPGAAGVALAVLTAATFSFTAESAQYWLAWRASSFLDVVANTIGAGLGAWLAAARRQAVRASAGPKTGLSVRSISASSPSVGSASE